jgi:hypothetical protein
VVKRRDGRGLQICGGSWQGFVPDCALILVGSGRQPVNRSFSHPYKNFCVQVTLRHQLRAKAPGLTPRQILEKFGRMQMMDVHFPTTDGRELVFVRYTQPEKDQQLLLAQMNWELPPNRHRGSRRMENWKMATDLYKGEFDLQSYAQSGSRPEIAERRRLNAGKGPGSPLGNAIHEIARHVAPWRVRVKTASRGRPHDHGNWRR